MDNLEYWTFVLGYDLLNDKLNGIPCDEAFEICENLALNFMESDYYKNNTKSGYECLVDFLENEVE